MLLTLRFFKILSVMMLFAGSLGALIATSFEDRRRFAWALALPGLGLTWAFGFGLASVMSRSLLSGWVLGALALSFVSSQVLLYSISKEGRRNWIVAVLVMAPLVSSVALMVWRPE